MKISSMVLYMILVIIAASSFVRCSIVVNEMELSSPEGSSNWVELYNSGNQTADISGWMINITDGSWTGKISVPKGTIIPAGGFYVGVGSPFWHHENGGLVTLNSDLGVKVDETPYEKDLLNNDFTWGRHPDGYDTDEDGDWGFAYATKGKSNTIGKS